MSKLIRLANKNDVCDINKLGNLLHNNFDTLYHIETEIDNDIAIVLVNIDNNKVNGYLYAINLYDNIDLLSICVDKDDRCKQIGTSLVKYLIDNYCYQKTITLEVSSKNEVAISFYEKLGFITINIRKNYYHDSDAYIMKWGIE